MQKALNKESAVCRVGGTQGHSEGNLYFESFGDLIKSKVWTEG